MSEGTQRREEDFEKVWHPHPFFLLLDVSLRNLGVALGNSGVALGNLGVELRKFMLERCYRAHKVHARNAMLFNNNLQWR